MTVSLDRLRPRTARVGAIAEAIAVCLCTSRHLLAWVPATLWRRERRWRRGLRASVPSSCEGDIDFFLGEILGLEKSYPFVERGTADRGVLEDCGRYQQ